MKTAARPKRKEAASSAEPQARPELVLVEGEDEFAVKERARELFQAWSAEVGGFDRDIIDGSANNAGEARRVVAKVHEALQTLPFFGAGKVVWLQNCNFLGDDRTSSAEAVKQALADLAAELLRFSATNVRILISATRVDRRKTFFKAVEKIGKVESYHGWSVNDSEWTQEAASSAERQVRARQKTITEEALAKLITMAGPNPRHLASEVEKLSLFVGNRQQIETADVERVGSPIKHSQGFALADAVGDRNLPRALHVLDQELWTLKTDRKNSEIGLLYGLISRIRLLIFAKELVRRGWVDPKAEFATFKGQLLRVPRDDFPSDRRFNPLANHPWALFNGVRQSRHFSERELVRAMELLLECNRRLVGSGLDEAMVLQQTLVEILSRN